MQRNRTIQLALLGAGGGVAAGVVVVALMWMFLPRGPQILPGRSGRNPSEAESDRAGAAQSSGQVSRVCSADVRGGQ